MNRQSHKSKRLRFRVSQNVAIAGLILLVVIGLIVSPIGKPPDTLSTLYILPYYKPVAMFAVRDKGGFKNRAVPFLPQSIEIASGDSPFNAYLVDVEHLSIAQLVAVRAAAEEQLQRGAELEIDAPIVRASRGQSRCQWRLGNWYWGRAHYLLLVAPLKEATADIQVRIGYGGLRTEQSQPQEE